MDDRQHFGVGSDAAPPVREDRHDSRRSYQPPVLERLGEWSALTLQQSIPVCCD